MPKTGADPLDATLKREGRYAYRFVIVGATGFLVDAVALWGLLQFGGSPFLARLGSIFIAVCVTFALNARYTFADRQVGLLKAFVLYSFTQSTGLLINYGVYSALVAIAPPPADRPLIALVIASIVAIPVTYLGARLVAFRNKQS